MAIVAAVGKQIDFDNLLSKQERQTILPEPEPTARELNKRARPSVSMSRSRAEINFP